MKKRYTVRIITVVVLVGVIVTVGYNFILSRQELTPKYAKRMLSKYKTEFTAIAEYVSEETRWDGYDNEETSREFYLSAEFLPEQIKKYMAVYFKIIVHLPIPSIYRIGEGSPFYDVKLHGETGAAFDMRAVYKGEDGEGCDVEVYQHLVYLKSDNPERYLRQIHLSVLGSIEQVADKWYLVTTSNHYSAF